MDPFGVEANFFPYLLSDWFGHKISISIIKSIKKNKSNAPVWFFVLKKLINKLYLFGAARETRTLMGEAHTALNRACLPVSAWPHMRQNN